MGGFKASGLGRRHGLSLYRGTDHRHRTLCAAYGPCLAAQGVVRARGGGSPKDLEAGCPLVLPGLIPTFAEPFTTEDMGLSRVFHPDFVGVGWNRGDCTLIAP